MARLARAIFVLRPARGTPQSRRVPRPNRLAIAIPSQLSRPWCLRRPTFHEVSYPMTEVELVNVFTHMGRGGNPCPIVVDASNLPSAGMQSVARHFGHESGFVLPAPGLDADYTFRFWVPRHEMEMCGHATIGALWALAIKGRLPGEQVRIATLSGPVTGYVDRGSSDEPSVEISQPVGKVVDLSRAAEEEVLAALKISRG